VTNENDENAVVTRITRAKAATLGAKENPADVPKKTVTTRKSVAALGTNGATQTRRRAALDDVSNVSKPEPAGAKNRKKATSAKDALSKPAAPTKIQKPTQNPRRPLEAKEGNTQVKRIASTNSTTRDVKKPKRAPVEEEVEEDIENVLAPVKEDPIKVEVKPTMTKNIDVIEEEELALDEDLVPDLDKEDIDDPLMVSEYVVEIFEYLKELEIATMANPDYMDSQTELEWKMRGILVDWLLEVHTRFRLLPETLFLAVNIIDRFLSAKIVQLDRLQLVGVTAMFIASKYEEVLSPHVQNFRHVADDGFTEEEILSAERFVLTALNYDLSYPNPMNFLRRISKADNYDIQTRTLGKYLLEIGCLDYRFIQYPPSHVAAAAMYLARLVLERGPWDATLTHYAGYSEDEIQPVLGLMIDYLSSPVVHEAFFKKYASKKFLKG
jgi:hypothetical protein